MELKVNLDDGIATEARMEEIEYMPVTSITMNHFIYDDA